MNGPVQIGQIDEGGAPREDGCSVGEPVDRTVVISDLVDSMLLRQHGWERAAPLIRHHNIVVTDVARRLAAEPDAGACEVLEYIGDATVLAFENATTALRCAWQIPLALAKSSAEQGDPPLEARVAVARGEIMRVEYRDESPYDWQGRPIDIAAKLISNVAWPSQVLVHETAKHDLDPAALSVKLCPVDGEKLPIESEAKDVRVYEVVAASANETQERLANRRRLIVELTKMLRQTYELKLALAELAGSIDVALRTGGVKEAANQMKTVGFVVGDLQDAWRDASEIEKTDAATPYAAVGKTWKRLRDVWRTEESVLRVEGEEGRRRPARNCHEAAGELIRSAEQLDTSIHRALDRIWPRA